jgi:hypothetical protein
VQVTKTVSEGRTFFDMPEDVSNPCLKCGACCTYFRISFYFGELDSHPSGFVPTEMASQMSPFRACMKGTESGNGRCVALKGEVGTETGCSIYENRPTPCREYAVWMDDGSPNPDCQKLRLAAGLPLLSSEQAMA